MLLLKIYNVTKKSLHYYQKIFTSLLHLLSSLAAEFHYFASFFLIISYVYEVDINVLIIILYVIPEKKGI